MGGIEVYARGKRRAEWLVYWLERGRVLGGNLEEIAQYIIGRRPGGGLPSSLDRIVAGILQQIVDVVEDLTPPPAGVHITACMLVPVFEPSGGPDDVTGLQTLTYSKNLSRNKSFIALDRVGPATEAWKTGVPKVVADTLEEPYREEFEGRPYRAVMAFPVKIGSGGGQKVAIVTVDATEAYHFTEETRIQKGIDAAIFPFLKLIGLARIAEQKGGRRGNK